MWVLAHAAAVPLAVAEVSLIRPVPVSIAWPTGAAAVAAGGFVVDAAVLGAEKPLVHDCFYHSQ